MGGDASVPAIDGLCHEGGCAVPSIGDDGPACVAVYGEELFSTLSLGSSCKGDA